MAPSKPIVKYFYISTCPLTSYTSPPLSQDSSYTTSSAFLQLLLLMKNILIDSPYTLNLCKINFIFSVRPLRLTRCQKNFLRVSVCEGHGISNFHTHLLLSIKTPLTPTPLPSYNSSSSWKTIS